MARFQSLTEARLDPRLEGHLLLKAGLDFYQEENHALTVLLPLGSLLKLKFCKCGHSIRIVYTKKYKKMLDFSSRKTDTKEFCHNHRQIGKRELKKSLASSTVASFEDGNNLQSKNGVLGNIFK